jgi:hypothetical protein
MKLPQAWKIHPVISIAHLEQYPQGNDPYEQPTPDQPGPIQSRAKTSMKLEELSQNPRTQQNQAKSGRNAW